MVAAAAVLGVLAALAVVQYLRTTDQRAYGNAELVQVFVVKRDIPRDYSADLAVKQGLIGKGTVPRQFRPPTSVTSLDTLAGKVALTGLSPNQVVVDGLFVDPKVAQRTFSQRIPPGNVAVTVSVDPVRGVAGLLVPGDRVNILAKDGSAQRLLFQNVSILAIGASAAPLPGEQPKQQQPAGSNLITFAVPPMAASKITYAAQQGGGIWLTLVPPDNTVQNLPPVDAGNLFKGGATPEEG